jgi:hypothetical protein
MCHFPRQGVFAEYSQALVHVMADVMADAHTQLAHAPYLSKVRDVDVLLLHAVKRSLPCAHSCQQQPEYQVTSTLKPTSGEEILQESRFTRGNVHVLVTDLKTPKMRPLLSVTWPSAPTCLSVIPFNLNDALFTFTHSVRKHTTLQGLSQKVAAARHADVYITLAAHPPHRDKCIW